MISSIAKIETLTITSKRPFTRSESEYLTALAVLFKAFNGIDHDGSFSMYIGSRTFLLANKKAERKVNPLVFVNEKGEVKISADISVFSGAIQEFKDYVDYYQKKNIPYEKALQQAIKDYKNDKLDFYSNSPILHEALIKKAENLLYKNKV